MAEKGTFERGFIRFCRSLGGPLRKESSKELKTSAAFLEWDIEPDMIIGAARLAMIGTFLLILAVLSAAFLVGINPLPLIVLLPASIGVFLLMTEWPKSLAKQKAMSALAFAPYIITQTCVSLKHKPNLEHALAFVAEYGEGMIARDIRHNLWELWTGKLKTSFSCLDNLAGKWVEFSQGFPRALYLIKSSFFEKKLEGKRDTLDKAIDVVLSDVTAKMTEYAHSLHMPTLVLFSIGTIVPLMLISLLPIVSFFGFGISPLTITAFLFVTILACYIYSTVVLKKRPAALAAAGGFEAPHAVTREAVSSGLVIAILLSVPTVLYLFAMSGAVKLYGPLAMVADVLGGFGMVWGVGLGIAAYCYITTSGIKKRRDRARRLEVQFIDSLYHIKNRLSDGRPMVSALKHSAELMGRMEISGMIKSILNRMQRKNVTLETAMKEEKIESGMINFVFKTLLESAREGREAAAQTARVMYDYLIKINEIERSLTTMLSKSLSMMKATVLFFAPIVCGIIVVLFQMITNTIMSAESEFLGGYGFQGIFTAPAISPGILQIIVGLYAVLLNFVLIRYVSRIHYGADDVPFRYELAKAMPVTLIVFTATLIGTRIMLLG